MASRAAELQVKSAQELSSALNAVSDKVKATVWQGRSRVRVYVRVSGLDCGYLTIRSDGEAVDRDLAYSRGDGGVGIGDSYANRIFDCVHAFNSKYRTRVADHERAANAAHWARLEAEV